MKAMVLEAQGEKLKLKDIPEPVASENEVLLKVLSCGICRTDLHVVDGDLKEPKLPLIPGHQIVGEIIAIGDSVHNLKVGDKVGVPWLGGSCGSCEYCNKKQENLCDKAEYTGYQLNGGFAELCTAKANYCFKIPDNYSDTDAAPLLCAGLIGYRCYKKCNDAKRIGIYGFGAAAHILTQVINFNSKETVAFTTPGDKQTQEFAKKIGAVEAYDSDAIIENKLDAAIIFAPVGDLVPLALQNIKKGGTLVLGGIHMSEIPAMPYEILWGERKIESVANLTRQDGAEFFELAPRIPIKTETTIYSLEDTNQALDDLRHGRFQGAAVIKIS